MRTKLLFFSLLFSGFLNAQVVNLELYMGGFTQPVDIAHANDDRMFVVEQGGRIKVINDNEGELVSSTFLNISSLISTGSERGLLGVAFHPNYMDNGYFFVNYTNTDGDTVIARYSVSETDANAADPDSAMILMTIEQPFSNHNGGCIKFGPEDGYLYIGMGDGGDGGDPGNRAQNINLLLGKMLRIDVDNGAPYSIPVGNPYIGVDGADEIWAIGLRNPWKFSFDREDGSLWIADVGQEQREEINHVAATEAGVNYGWRCYEGLEEYNMTQCGGITGFTMPAKQYLHSESVPNHCSITGGYVYSGSSYPNLQGKYVFADYCSNKIGVLDTQGDITWTDVLPGNNFFTTFGEDQNGELYVAGRSTGNVYKIVDTTAGTSDFAGGTYTVYPNPADNEVFVELKNVAAPASVSIFDIRGKLLVQQNVEENASRIDTSALGSGMYLMRLESSGTVRHHKLVIQ